MPNYIYIDDRDGKTYDVIQKMSEEHIAFAPDGYKLRRIFWNPSVAVDTKWDEDSPQDFIEKSGKKRGKIQDLWDKSKELSLKREQKFGRDEVKEEHFKNYKLKHRNRDHPEVRKKKLKESLDKKGLELTDN